MTIISQEALMTGIKTGISVILFHLLFFSLCSPALAKKTVTILYTGCTYGQISSFTQ